MLEGDAGGGVVTAWREAERVGREDGRESGQGGAGCGGSEEEEEC